MNYDQIIIGICGITSVWLSQDAHEGRRRFACIFGLCAQPAWFYATWSAGQWGIFVLCLVYTVGWARGVYNFWIVPRIASK